MGPLLGALLFWGPIVGVRRRTSDAARTSLDLAGVRLVAVGEIDPGLAMIVGMTPMEVIAAVVTWNWIHGGEQRAAAAEQNPRRAP